MSQQQALAIDVLTVGQNPVVSDLIRVLDQMGAQVRMVGVADVPVGSTLVVVLGPELESAISEERLREYSGRYRDMIPVTTGRAGESGYFRDLSHLLLADAPVPESAAVVMQIATVGGRQIVGWNRLLDRAKEWVEAPGQTALLKEPEVESARLLVAELPDSFDVAARGLVQHYIATSATAITKRRRRAVSVLTFGVVALVALIVLAGVQTVNANHSRNEAREAQRAADADRLADYAVQVQSTDPDLPSILVSAAAELKKTDRVRAAANTISAGTWPHTSIELAGFPTRLSAASGSARAAVQTRGAKEIQIFDTHKGEPVGTVPSEDGDMMALNPSGDLLATQRPSAETILVHSTDGSGPPQLVAVPAGSTLLDWYDSDHLALGVPEGLATVPVSGGATVTVIPVTAGEEVRAFARSADNSVTGVVTLGALYAVRGSGQPIRIPVEGAMDVAVTANGDRIAIAGHPANTLVGFDGAGKPQVSVMSESQRGTRVVATGGSKFVFSSWDGRLLSEPGEGWIVAHSGGRFVPAMAGDDILATIGTDGFLRLWQPNAAARVAQPLPHGLRSMTDAGFMPGSKRELRESTRNQIRIQTGASVATVIQQPNYGWTVDASDGTATKNRPTFFGGLNTDSALSPGGSALVNVSSNRVLLGRIEPDGSIVGEAKIEGRMIGTAIASTGTGIVGVADDASTAVVADPTHLYCWSNAGGTTTNNRTFDVDRKPVVLMADTVNGVPQCRAITADGFIRDQHGIEKAIPGLVDDLTSGAVSLTAGSFPAAGGPTIVVADSGDLYEVSETGRKRIGSIGADMHPFGVSVSPSGRVIAVMGRGGTSFVERESGLVLHHEPADGTFYLSDVAFRWDSGPDAALAVSSMGEVRVVALPKTAEDCGRPLCSVTVPRAASAQERRDFSVPAGVGE